MKWAAVIVTAVFISPQADIWLALVKLHAMVNEHQTAYANTLPIIIKDFDKASFKRSLPNHYHNATHSTRGLNSISHCCSTTKDAYCSTPHPLESQTTWLLRLLTHRQWPKSSAPVVRGGRGKTLQRLAIDRLGDVQGLGNIPEQIRHVIRKCVQELCFYSKPQSSLTRSPDEPGGS